MTESEKFKLLCRSRDCCNKVLGFRYLEEEEGVLTELITDGEYEVIIDLRDRLTDKLNEIVRDNHVLTV